MAVLSCRRSGCDEGRSDHTLFTSESNMFKGRTRTASPKVAPFRSQSWQAQPSLSSAQLVARLWFLICLAMSEVLTTSQGVFSCGRVQKSYAGYGSIQGHGRDHSQGRQGVQGHDNAIGQAAGHGQLFVHCLSLVHFQWQWPNPRP